tara:strand:+ start:472 stop:702 length:231 start_codon:yes stop_codon:yes gene_type:complete
MRIKKTPEELKIYQKEYREKNKKKQKVYDKKYYENRKKVLSLRNKENYKNSKEKNEILFYLKKQIIYYDLLHNKVS